MNTYAQLKAAVQELRRNGTISARPSDAQRADWAYGTTKIENDGVTRAMAEEAVRLNPATR